MGVAGRRGRVIDVCRDQIRGLSHLSFEQELVGARPAASPQDEAKKLAVESPAQSDPF